MMRAMVYDRYGPPEVLRLEEIERPAPGAGEVLVKVEAVSLNLSDWECLTGYPLYARLHGVFRPRHRILGSDLAGWVEAVGPDVTNFAPGDAVFGDTLGTFGGFAEYAAVPARVLVKKPDALSFEQVATLPQAVVIARQGLLVGGGLRPGQRVLINGAGGGSGMFAIQIAKREGVEVTAVDARHKLDHMRELGADRVLDYREVDFTRTGERYDLVLDLVGTRSVFAHRRALRDGGTYGIVGGTMNAMLQTLALGPVVGRLSGTRLKVVGATLSGEEPRNEHYAPFLEQLIQGTLKLSIDQRFTLEQAAEAVRYHGEGRARGKVVVLP